MDLVWVIAVVGLVLGGWLFVRGLHQRRELTRRIARCRCRSCRQPYGPAAAAARERVPVTGPLNWWVSCPACGERAMVNHWLLAQ